MGGGSRFDRYRPRYEQTLDLVDLVEEEEEHEGVEEEMVELASGRKRPLSERAPSAAVQADPEFAVAAVCCVIPLGLLYAAFMVWSVVVLVGSTADETATACGADDMWWIVCASAAVAWGSMCLSLCSTQAATNAVNFAASGSPAAVLLLRSTPETSYAIISALGSIAISVWGWSIYSQQNDDCFKAVEDGASLGLATCFLATMGAQFLNIWYRIWCGIYTCNTRIRQLGEPGKLDLDGVGLDGP